MSVDVASIIEDQKALLGAIVTEQAAILTALTALRTGNEPDYSGLSKSEDGGSQSWSIATLQDRFDTLANEQQKLVATIAETQKMVPFLENRRVHVGGSFINGPTWRGWW